VLKFRLRGLVFDWAIFKKSLAIGLPTGVQQVVVAAGLMTVTRIVNGFGTNALAAYTAAGRLDSFAAMPAMNLSMAVSTFVGQNLGAGKMERVKDGLKAALLISVAISLAITLIVVFFGRPLIALFNSNAEVVAMGSSYLLIVGSFYILFSSMFVISGVMRGAGDTFIPMAFTILALWFVRVPWSAWLSEKMGTDGIWWGVPIAWTMGLILTALYYATGRWKRKVAVKPLAAPTNSKLQSQVSAD
jgi:putative MATE family efflux protein